jgi:N-acetylglucosamine kinase-like BadF-type ATPase
MLRAVVFPATLNNLSSPMARKTLKKTKPHFVTRITIEPNPLAPPFFTLGLEGGGTKTTWILLDSTGAAVGEGKAGPANIQLLTDAEIVARFEEIKAQGARVAHQIGGAFAGCHLEKERTRVKKAAQQVWPDAKKILIGEDTQSAIYGALGREDGLIVIAGTGSNAFGRKGRETAKAGGWGHLFADPGSGYDTARRGLVAVYAHYDATQKVTPLGKEYLKLTKQKNLEELVPFVLAHGSKTEVAALAPAVFNAAKKGDKLAKQVLADGVGQLALRAVQVMKRLRLKNSSIGLIGSLFEKNPAYLAAFKKQVNQTHPGSKIFVSTTPGALGAARMVLLS